MGGGACGNNDGGLDVKTIGAIIGTTWAVATAWVLYMTSDTPSGNERGNTFKETIPCLSISKKLAKCLESNGYDIKKCVAYFDLLKEAEKPLKNEAEKSKMKEADKPRRTY